ncbi:S8 family serine peptidase [Oculatella sp. FACHB-28]|uniref:S8 family peptidase n=1 Tax=Oculatella sp. FACHB-28 TaxID=2692845 RepID=UPI0016893901|nr:S8 family serine peptidase [Oculatella sp. FACHB-28]MBD2055030.1 S8 family serine peptidase [Oculatella sp. FACHB-28]
MKPLTQISSATIVTTTLLGGLCMGTQAATLIGEYLSKSGSKVSSSLISLSANSGNNTGLFPGTRANSSLLQTYGGHVVIDAIASDNTDVLYEDLLGLGLQNGSKYGSLVSGLLPLDAISSMDSLSSLKFARPTQFLSNVGVTTSQADRSMRADIARSTFGVDGTGVTVGALSDSYNNLDGEAADIASGDLPSNVNVLLDLPSGGSDEGRAMLQLIHDVAPGADLAFYTAFLGGQADFANGILELAASGSDVIVDDVINLAEPMFQDGIIAQAVDQVVADGIPYFSSAGNNDRNAYESTFRNSSVLDPIFGGELHDFDPSAGVDPFQSISVPVGGELFISFQWDSPFFSVSGGEGSPNDLDIFLFDDFGNLLALGADANEGGDAVEILSFFNDGSFGTDQFNLAISNFSGPDAGFMKYVVFGNASISEYDTNSGTVYGHANAEGAEAVGASFYADTPEFGTNPPVLEPFSSAGSTPILFDENGDRLFTPEIRLKPEIVAPDGTNTTFFIPGLDVEGDGFPNFFGTSAAAPHAAAVAALMLEAAPSTSPEVLYETLEETAIDMNAPGFDFDSGFGLIQADRAVGALISTPPEEVPEPASVFGLLAVIVGAGSRLKRKPKAA